MFRFFCKLEVVRIGLKHVPTEKKILGNEKTCAESIDGFV